MKIVAVIILVILGIILLAFTLYAISAIRAVIREHKLSKKYKDIIKKNLKKLKKFAIM